MTPQDAIAKAARGEITLVDVREANELAATGTAAGALHIPLALIGLQAAEKIPAGRPVVLFCAVGGRAGMAAQALSGMGYEAHNIGGFSDWAQAGGPVTR
jgi:rhodanese-related sulfurtransferase